MNGTTLFVFGFATIGAVVGGVKLASQPDRPEPTDTTPVVTEAPVAVTEPKAPPLIQVASPASAGLQAAPMDPTDPNSPAGIARTALVDAVPRGYLTQDENGWPLWNNPIIGWANVTRSAYDPVQRRYVTRTYEVPVHRYSQSMWAGAQVGLLYLHDDTAMDCYDRLMQHGMGFDPRKLDRINYE